jgi:hypothetical protein
MISETLFHMILTTVQQKLTNEEYTVTGLPLPCQPQQIQTKEEFDAILHELLAHVEQEQNKEIDGHLSALFSLNLEFTP